MKTLVTRLKYVYIRKQISNKQNSKTYRIKKNIVNIIRKYEANF